MKSITQKIVKSLLLFSIFFSLFAAHAQVPQKMSYQAVIRNASNALVANTAVAVKVSLFDAANGATPVYVERHTTTTNSNGLATFNIGTGTIISGVFANINWANVPMSIQTETDPAGGINYTIVGTNDLTSVPFSLNSGDNRWTKIGNDIINNNQGNVGIGTSTPSSSSILTVRNENGAGLLKLESAMSSTQITMDDSGTNDVALTSTQGNFDIWTGGNNKRLSILTNGNVGIGKDNPNYPLSFPPTYGEKLALWDNTTARVGFAVQPGNFQMLSDVSGTDITFGYGSSASPIEQMRIKGNTGNVGIGINNPGTKLDILGGNWNLTGTSAGDFRVGNATNNFKLGVATTGSGAGHTTMTSSLILSLGTGTTDPNVRTLNVAGGNVGIGTISPTTKLEVNGFTKLGSDAPAIKIKKIIGTSGASQNSSSAIPHGLTFSKILSVSVLIDSGIYLIPEAYDVNGFDFSYYLDATNIFVINSVVNSSNILSKPIKILITYEE